MNPKIFIDERFIKPVHKRYAKFIWDKPDKHIWTVVGIRRTGNHAIINWLLHQLKGGYSFCNDIAPSQFPFDSRFKESKFRPNTKNLLVSYEDHSVENVILEPLNTLGEYSQRTSILLLRNPFNLFASWYRWDEPLGVKFRENESYRKEMIDLWKSHARFWVSNKGPEVIGIFFDKWVDDKMYRQQISKQLRLNFNDNSIKKVKGYGGGSSFEKNLNSNVNNRSELYKDVPFFKDNVLKDVELSELWTEVIKPLS